MDLLATESGEPTLEISLLYSCGCRDVWLVYHLAGRDAVTMCSLPCVPEICQSCQRDGMCETRRAMPPAHEHVDFQDIKPVRKQYRRMELTA